MDSTRIIKEYYEQLQVQNLITLEEMNQSLERHNLPKPLKGKAVNLNRLSEVT